MTGAMRETGADAMTGAMRGAVADVVAAGAVADVVAAGAGEMAIEAPLDVIVGRAMPWRTRA